MFRDRKNFTTMFTKILLRTIFPFLVITSILNADFGIGQILIIAILFCLVVVFSGMGFVIIFFKLKNNISKNEKRFGSALLAVGFPNSVFLPFPIIIMVVGIDGLIVATIFAIVIIIVQNTLGSWIGVNFGNQKVEKQGNVKELLKKIFYFPPTIAMIFGIAVKIIFQPKSTLDMLTWIPTSINIIQTTIDLISWISLILALLVVGLTFDINTKIIKNAHLIELSIIRLLIAPSIGFMFLLFSSYLIPEILSFATLIPLMIQAISGPAIINIAFAQQFNLDVELESFYITFITLMSLILLIPLLLSYFIFIG